MEPLKPKLLYRRTPSRSVDRQSVSSRTLRLIVLFSMVLASESNAIPAINSLRSPTTPPVVLLGIEQTSVESPSTPAALGFTILNSTNALTTIPKDFGIQATPYWLTNHTSLTWQDDTLRSVSNSILRTLAISAATAQIGSDSFPSTGLSVGFSASLLSGKTSRNTIDALHKVQEELSRQTSLMEDPNLTDLEIDQIVQASEERLTAALNSVSESRVNWRWELSGGLLWSFPDGSAAKGRCLGGGAWSTLSYSTESKESFLFVARYLDNRLASTDRALDFGVRYLHEATLWSISLESVERVFVGGMARPDEHRLTAMVEYKIGSTGSLTFAFGQDFDRHASNSLLARLGLSIGINPVRALDSK